MIRYKAGYKYQLTEAYNILLPFHVMNVSLDYLAVSHNLLTIQRGYAWDGPSGPTFDTKNFMRGSLVHDALYQLMRSGVAIERKQADELLRTICLEDGMSSIRAWWVYNGVRLGGGPAASVRSDEALIAP